MWPLVDSRVLLRMCTHPTRSNVNNSWVLDSLPRSSKALTRPALVDELQDRDVLVLLLSEKLSVAKMITVWGCFLVLSTTLLEAATVVDVAILSYAVTRHEPASEFAFALAMFTIIPIYIFLFLPVLSDRLKWRQEFITSTDRLHQLLQLARQVFHLNNKLGRFRSYIVCVRIFNLSGGRHNSLPCH